MIPPCWCCTALRLVSTETIPLGRHPFVERRQSRPQQEPAEADADGPQAKACDPPGIGGQCVAGSRFHIDGGHARRFTRSLHVDIRIRFKRVDRTSRGWAGGAPVGCAQRSEDRLARAVALDHAVVEEHHPVGERQRIQAVGDDKDRSPARLQLLDRLDQRRFADVVEIGVGLVEHDQAGVAIERAGEPDALALAAGQHAAAVADAGVVALGHPQDHLVHARAPGGVDDRFGIDVAEARDVLGDGAVEQLDVLRQIADRWAKRGAVPAFQRMSVEENPAFGVRPDPDQRADQCRFARARRPDDRRELSGRELACRGSSGSARDGWARWRRGPAD